MKKASFVAACAACILPLLLPFPADAQQDQGLVEGRVVNEQGEPLAGVAVTITHPDRPDFEIVDKTNKRGKFKATIEGQPGEYDLHLEKEGYAPFDTQIDVQMGMTLDVSLRMVDESKKAQVDAVRLYNEGVKALQAGNEEEAAGNFEQSTELNPELPEPLRALTVIYLNQGKLDQAHAALEKYLALKPDDPLIAPMAFEIYYRKGEVEKARQMAELVEGPDARADLAVPVFNQGVQANRADDVDEALKHFRYASELDPSLAPAFQGMAAIEFNRENYEESLEHLEGLLAASPTHREGLRLRYLANEILGQHEAARSALKAYLEEHPEAAEDIVSRAETDFENENLAAARQTLENLLEVRPEMASAHYQLGLVYASSGDGAAAKEHLQRFIELAPDHAEAANAKQMIQEL